MNRMAACLAVVLLSSCASRQPPVRVGGDPVAIAWLAGAWTGEYWIASSARRGSLDFYLEGATDSLFGDVVMLDAAGKTVQPADAERAHQVHVRVPQRLRIDLVLAHGDTVRGRLEPYLSPECQCTVSTSFLGTVQGNVILGTFESEGAAGWRADGFWRMGRVGSLPRAP